MIWYHKGFKVSLKLFNIHIIAIKDWCKAHANIPIL